ARVRAVIAQELVPDLVELVGADAWGDVPSHLGQRLRGNPGGDPHRLDGRGVLDVGLADLRVALADVFRPLDLRGDLPGPRHPARPQPPHHDLILSFPSTLTT